VVLRQFEFSLLIFAKQHYRNWRKGKSSGA